MSENTKIEWCDYSWSPWTGCTKVSAGCAHCYAEARDKRHLQEKIDHWGKGAPRLLRAESSWKEPLKWNKAWNKAQYFTRVQGQPEPAKSTIFPSLCDWLDEEVPVEWLARFLGLIYDTPNLNWLLLTKRPENWRSRMNAVANADFTGLEAGTELADAWTDCLDMPERGAWPENVWIGTSVEDQANADRRIPELLKIPAVRRFLSLEPLLGPVDLVSDIQHHSHPLHKSSPINCIDWLIIGGESGRGARPCHVDWIRSLVKQGKEAGVATFVKHPKGGEPSEWPVDLRVREFPEGLQ